MFYITLSWPIGISRLLELSEKITLDYLMDLQSCPLKEMAHKEVPKVIWVPEAHSLAFVFNLFEKHFGNCGRRGVNFTSSHSGS